MEKRLEEYENNFYSIEYKPEVKIPNLKKPKFKFLDIKVYHWNI